MYYLPAFQVLQQRLKINPVNGRSKINISYDELLDAFRQLLWGTKVDEAWYLAQYTDVADAVASGAVKSAKHHFVQSGYFEGRLPHEFEVDETWYVKNNPDVAAGIREGTIASATRHFREHGYAEGRLPAAL